VSVLLDLIYLLAALIASPWVVYRLFVRGDRRSLAARFGAGLGDAVHGSIWLHGSSAGEIALLVPLVDRLERSGVTNPIVISAYSATGFAAARKAFPGRRVIFFPFDLSFVIRRFFSRLDPRLIVIVEAEFWPNFLRTAARRNVPVTIINGKMSEKSFRFHARTRLVPALLRGVELVAAQTDAYGRRLLALGFPSERLRVTGNMKYDLIGAPEQMGDIRELRARLGYEDDDIVIIGGSVHEREDKALIVAFEKLAANHPRAALVLVPRYPRDADRVEQLASAHGFTAVRKTVVDQGDAAAPGGAGIFVVDTVGDLRALYGIADVAFVGGSLFFRGSNRGGHNLMEPAVLGLPVIFGPFNFSFADTARELVTARGGFEVGDVDALIEVLQRLLDDAALRVDAGRRARDVIAEGQGATQRNFELLMPLIDAANGRLPASGLGPTMPPAMSDLDLNA
jgi:3-deoxy-D-manno-octulosonic-acid transferase